MILSEAILNCKNYEDSEENMYVIYSKKIDEKFHSDSEAIILELTPEEMEIKWTEIAAEKCPGFEYFLEMFVLKDIYEDLLTLEELESNDKKVERIIYYAEFDA